MVLYVVLSFIVGALLSGIIVYVRQNKECVRLNAEKAELNTQLESGKVAIQAKEELFKSELTLAKEQMKSQFEQELKVRTEQFKQANAEQMNHVVQPLQKELGELRELVNKTKENQDKSTAALHESIRTVFEHDQQRDKTTKDLAEALKNRGKVQGDWGEQVLTNILSDSGLREGIEYFFQKSVKGEDGQDLRPDVIVRAADGTSIIIDSKVSLTAYTDYVGAESEEERKQAVKDNYDSLWKHVTELSGKDYRKEIDNAIPIVLMFVPNEGSYILAMNKDPQLGTKAYKKGVLIINPTNLMLVLELILKTWQNTRQEENYTAILKAAEGVYEKYVGFAENYVKLGEKLEAGRKAYEEGLGQLKDGKGNLSNRVQSLLSLGVTSKKPIPKEVSSISPDNILEN
ncbi:MAG: DNA recombination protein RmuC [Paludibacteraceae bacterium]|nr:DNA recombination protein RmuC [Paludibacteraceae bacterium]